MSVPAEPTAGASSVPSALRWHHDACRARVSRRRAEARGRTSTHGAGHLARGLHGRGIAAQSGGDALIVTADGVGAAFFDLRAGLAGESFQKATQYGLPLALVLPDPALHGQRRTELAFEHGRHHAVRIVRSRAEADAWLAAR